MLYLCPKVYLSIYAYISPKLGFILLCVECYLMHIMMGLKYVNKITELQVNPTLFPRGILIIIIIDTSYLFICIAIYESYITGTRTNG
jgi:hypothetical protein